MFDEKDLREAFKAGFKEGAKGVTTRHAWQLYSGLRGADYEIVRPQYSHLRFLRWFKGYVK